MNLKEQIKTYPDYPIKGVNFFDITSLFHNSDTWNETVDQLTELVKKYNPTRLCALDSKGFIFAAPVAYRLGIGFSLLRKKSKLPGNVIRQKYDLEYGTDEIECRDFDIEKNDRVVVIDDVLATGGTLSAGIKLVQKIGGNVVGAITVLHITNLNGIDKIKVPYSALLDVEE